MTGGFKLVKILDQKPWLITLGLAGVLVVVAGLLTVGNIWSPPADSEIEIITASAPPATFLVDIGGAVENPGVYEFASDSRVNDVLVAAGGLAAAADRDWISQNLNLAKKLTDGEKIYIPWQDEGNNKVGPSSNKGPILSEQININNASLVELDTLWGIGPATAQKIIDGRPYAKTEDLLEKKIVKTNVFEAIKDSISVL